ncbi:hypothetical protein BGZ83_005604 [Gryganskiella cystojenkinii]|nr:hypothetical protein BGZ83_005604 [Gryganskiella cystojenkinii]
MTTPTTRESSGLKSKVMRFAQAALLSTLLMSATACTVQTTTQIKYIMQGTVSNPTTIAFGNSQGYHSEFQITCKKGGRFTKCDDSKLFCATYNCSPLKVTLYSQTYMKSSLGKGFTKPSASETQGAYTLDNYYSCY